MITPPFDQKQFQNKVKLFEAIIQHSQDGIIVFNDKFEAIFANEAFGEMVEMDPLDVRGVSLSSFIPEGKRINHEKLVVNFSHSKNEQQRLDEWRAIQCCRSDGTLFPARIIINKYHISNRVIFIVSLRDMTQVLHFEQETSKAEFAQFQAEQRKRCLVRVLRLNLEKTIKDISNEAQKITIQSEDEQTQTVIKTIRDKSHKASSIIQKAIVLVSKRANDYDRSSVDHTLFGSVERIRMIMDECAREKNLTLTWDIPTIVKNYQPQNAQIIEQIIYNILDDAISNASAGQIQFAIKQIYEDPQRQVVMDMQCTNSRFGISQTLLNEVLKAPSFSKIPRDTNLKFDGMCLRLAQYLTEQSKGLFHINSHPVEGTQVFVKLKGVLK